MLKDKFSIDHLADAMNIMSSKQMTYADIYLQEKVVEVWSLDEGVVKEGSYHASQGAGLRVLNGEKTAFSYTDSFEKKELLAAAKTCSAIYQQGDSKQIAIASVPSNSTYYQPIIPDSGWTSVQKVDFLRSVEVYAKQLDKRVVQVNASLSSSQEEIAVLNNEGRLCFDNRPLVRCNIMIIVEHDKRREMGSVGAGGRFGLTGFLTQENMKRWVDEAVRIATVNLEAQAAPAGTYPIALGSGWPGVLLHEAVGHGLEADFNRKKTSVFADKVGKQVASSVCTVVDNGTLENRRGSLNIDDEGTPAQSNTLIENGILKGYMQDTQNAQLMNMPLTGNARRQSYAHLPMPRMTNTYMLAGQSSPEDIISSIDKGLYAVNFNGGQVDITSGQFTFTASEAYWVENGKIQYPVKNATLVGNGPDVMQKISMVGNDLELDRGVGVCGKAGQSVPVGVGQPTLRVDEIVIGGTQ